MPRARSKGRKPGKGRSKSTDGDSTVTDIDPLEFRCGICLDTMFRPCTLVCGHSCCEFCLASFIRNQQRQRRHITSLRCPAMCNQTLTPSFPAVNNILNNQIRQLFPDDEAKSLLAYTTENQAAVIASVRARMPTQAAIIRAYQRRNNHARIRNNGEGNDVDDEDEDWEDIIPETIQWIARTAIQEFKTLYGTTWSDKVIVYASILSWFVFACVCGFFIFMEHQHCSKNLNSIGPFPESSSSYFYLKCPIRDLPTFYQEDVQEGSSYLVGGMGKINTSRFGTTTNASFHYEYRVDPAMHQSMPPIIQLLSHPNTFQISISEWLKRDPTASFWFNKRHLMLIVYFLPLVLPRLSTLLWLDFSSHGAIFKVLLNPLVSLQNLYLWLNWMFEWTNHGFFVFQSGMPMPMLGHQLFWTLFVFYPRFLPMWYMLSFRAQDPGMVVTHILLQVYLSQYDTIHICGYITKSITTIFEINPEAHIGWYGQLVYIGRYIKAVWYGITDYNSAAVVCGAVHLLLFFSLSLLWPLIPWVIADSGVWLCTSGLVAVSALCFLSSRSLHIVRNPNRTEFQRRNECRCFHRWGEYENCGVLRPFCNGLGYLEYINCHDKSHRGCMLWSMRTCLKTLILVGIFLLMQTPRDPTLISSIINTTDDLPLVKTNKLELNNLKKQWLDVNITKSVWSEQVSRCTKSAEQRVYDVNVCKRQLDGNGYTWFAAARAVFLQCIDDAVEACNLEYQYSRLQVLEKYGQYVYVDRPYSDYLVIRVLEKYHSKQVMGDLFNEYLVQADHVTKSDQNKSCYNQTCLKEEYQEYNQITEKENVILMSILQNKRELMHLITKQIQSTNTINDISWKPYPWLSTPHDRRKVSANRSMIHINTSVGIWSNTTVKPNEKENKDTKGNSHTDDIPNDIPKENKIRQVIETFPLTYMHAVHPEVLLCALVFVLIDWKATDGSIQRRLLLGRDPQGVDHRNWYQKLTHRLVSRFWTTMLLTLFLGSFYESNGYNKINNDEPLESTTHANESESNNGTGYWWFVYGWFLDGCNQIGDTFDTLLSSLGNNLLYYGSGFGVLFENWTASSLKIYWGATIGIDLIIAIGLALAKLNVHVWVLYVWLMISDGGAIEVEQNRQRMDNQIRRREALRAALQERRNNGLAMPDNEVAAVRAMNWVVIKEFCFTLLILAVAFGSYILLLWVNQRIMY